MLTGTFRGFSLDNFPPDGLMGLAFQSISVFNKPPFIDTLVQQGVVAASQFAFRLADAGSELFLGGADDRLYTGSISWNTVVREVSLSSFN